MASVFNGRRQLSDEVASYLREAIMAGEIASGESVRAESVGEQLSVSATPVREALQLLKAEGFLKLIPRKGFTVAPLVADDIRDLFSAHALIAGELTARAAENAEADSIAHLEELHFELLSAARERDHEQLEQLNHDFHKMVYRLAQSDRLVWALGIFTKYVPRRFYSTIAGWPETTARDHAAIIDAIKDGSAQRARNSMSTHIKNAGELLAEHYYRRVNEAQNAVEAVR